jgi:hypothetical protein
MVNSLIMRKFQLLGDSKVVVDWVNGKFDLQVVGLNLLKARIHSLLLDLDWFSCCHIYKELNALTNKLSKESLTLMDEAFIFQEIYDGESLRDMSFLL